MLRGRVRQLYRRLAELLLPCMLIVNTCGHLNYRKILCMYIFTQQQQQGESYNSTRGRQAEPDPWPSSP